jgi:hypothetical protein
VEWAEGYAGGVGAWGVPVIKSYCVTILCALMCIYINDDMNYSNQGVSDLMVLEYHQMLIYIMLSLTLLLS